MSQPKCTGVTANGPNTGNQCQRLAVHGSDKCQAHGGAAKSIGEALKAKRQCNYTKRNGERCQKAPIRGGSVCVKHGGNAVQIRKKANERLMSMVEPALVEIQKILLAPGTSDGDKLRAATMVLDRTGYGRGMVVEHIQEKPWEVTMQHILTELPADYEPSRSDDYIDAEVIEEASTADIADNTRRANLPPDMPVLGPQGVIRTGRVVGSADPPKRRNPYDD